MIIEVGFKVINEKDILILEAKLAKIGYDFYIEPMRDWESLEDLECACEGK